MSTGAAAQPAPQEVPVALKRKDESWYDRCQRIVAEQCQQLTDDRALAQLLRDNAFEVLFRAWSDVSRFEGSSMGDNITDTQFVTFAPSLKSTVDGKKGDMVCFPAIRPGNFADKTSLHKPTDRTISRIIDRDGVLHRDVKLSEIVDNLGLYNADLPRHARFGDEVDQQLTQVASQFSVLPVKANEPANVGISVFDYAPSAAGNLHMIIGPNGEVGWTVSDYETVCVMFRDQENKQHRAIQIAVDGRKDIVQRFLKPEAKDESLVEEAKRYEELENTLTHIQLQIVRPPMKARSRGVKAQGLMGMLASAMPKSKGKSGKFSLQSAKENCVLETAECSKQSMGDDSECEEAAMESMVDENDAEEEEEEEVEFTLARVSLGRPMGNIQDSERVTEGMTRAKGVRMRVTRMSYAVSSAGNIKPEPLDRFFKQMTYRQRLAAAHHGSLVTGEGSWGGKDQVPIKLKPMPATMAELFALIEQWPVGQLEAFSLGGPGSVGSLQVLLASAPADTKITAREPSQFVLEDAFQHLYLVTDKKGYLEVSRTG